MHCSAFTMARNFNKLQVISLLHKNKWSKTWHLIKLGPHLLQKTLRSQNQQVVLPKVQKLKVQLLIPILVQSQAFWNHLGSKRRVLRKNSWTLRRWSLRSRFSYSWVLCSQSLFAASFRNVWSECPKITTCSWTNTTAKSATKRQRWYRTTSIVKTKLELGEGQVWMSVRLREIEWTAVQTVLWTNKLCWKNKKL